MASISQKPAPVLPSSGIVLVDAAFRRLSSWIMEVPMKGRFNSDLASISDLTPADGNFIVGDGTDWVAESGATARTSLGLGTAAVQAYEEGAWTPVLTFATPGDLSVTYSVQVGTYTKIGRLVTVAYRLDTSAFTHTTASGAASITGLPFTARTLANAFWYGTLAGGGVTKASYTSFNARAATASAALGLVASGSGQTHSAIAAADMPTGGSVQLLGAVTYETA